MTGMGKTFVYARMKEGTFPKQIQLGSRSVVWNEQEVIKWMKDQIASRRSSSGSFASVRGLPRNRRRVIIRVFLDYFGK